MTAMVDDIGQRGDVAVASLLAEVHNPRRCRDCQAGTCETGAWATRRLAAHRAARRSRPPQQSERPQAAANGIRSAMSQIQWKTLRCDNSGPNCPEIATEGDMVYLRSSERPMDIAVLTVGEWDTLRQKIRDGEV